MSDKKEMKTMWAGRFKKGLDEKAAAFNNSLGFDKRLYRQDILGSIAHCTMLGECGIIPAAEAKLIAKTLSEILKDITDGKLLPQNAEDIHMFVEEELTARIGEIGKKLHTARSRNDQVALDFRLYLLESSTDIISLLKSLVNKLISTAKDNLTSIIPAYTHMQKAQPTTLAHYLMAYAEMFMRDMERMADCKKRIAVMPLGSGACTGTTFPIDRKRVAELLGFESVSANSLDAVSDRDFAAEYLFVCSMISVHLSRISEEFIYWSSDEFGYLSFSDSYSTGSSMMPQKKNPDICELIRGKSGRAIGSLTALLTMIKGLPLAYNKDLQEDKELVFGVDDTLKDCLSIFTSMFSEIEFNLSALKKGAEGGYMAATDCADYLVTKGVPFRQAHEIIGNLVKSCIDAGKKLTDLTLDDFNKASPLFEADILKKVTLEEMVERRTLPGGCSSKSVKEEIKNAEKFLSRF